MACVESAIIAILTLSFFRRSVLHSQIDRGHGTVARGRLAQLLTEGTSPNPRWLVKFDGQPYKDEEMYEHAFGKLVHSAEEPDDMVERTTATTPTSNKQAKGGAVSGTSSEGEKSDTSSSSKKSKNKKKNSKKQVAVQVEENGRDGAENSAGDVGGLSDDSSPSGIDTSGRSKADRVSAREARSKRRQAKIDEELPVGDVMGPSGKRKLASAVAPTFKKLKGNSFNGEVTQIKMLTGTLFLYRGAAQRRVEFVPRV
jgi:hypothetical protein